MGGFFAAYWVPLILEADFELRMKGRARKDEGLWTPRLIAMHLRLLLFPFSVSISRPLTLLFNWRENGGFQSY